jgi:SAM-dependent methyltransferase
MTGSRRWIAIGWRRRGGGCWGGGSMRRCGRGWRVGGPFPDPIAVWVDSVGSADTQAVAYRHLAPVDGMRVLQLGGSGSHVIKALLAGAAQGVLLSPSLEEVRLGRALADDVGVGDRFVGVVAIGELMPLLDGSVDRIYGGGCLHHTAVEQSVPELARVLAPGGRAAFVDPRDNAIYRAWSALMGAPSAVLRR